MALLVMKSWYTPAIVEQLPQAYFIFGDNDLRKGMGGQACIRECPNSLGVRTKKLPSDNPEAYYTDEDYDANVRKMSEDFLLVEHKLSYGYIVFWPADGIGTGRAKLNETAPRTFSWLNSRVGYLLGAYSSLSKAA